MTVPVAAADPVCGHPDFCLADVVLRLARDDERREWDQLMDTQHYLGFRQFAGRGLRYVAEWHGRWLALLGWQTGVFQCAPRDKWIGWDKGVQMPRLHLCANNTRFLILPAATGVKNLGSYVLGANLRRLSADWERNWGHCRRSHYLGGGKGGIVGLFVICYRRTKRGQFGVDTPGRGKGPFSGRSAPFEGPSCYPDHFGGRK